MNLADIEKENSSNEEDNGIDTDKENRSLKEKKPRSINKVHKLDKKKKIIYHLSLQLKVSEK